jgi:hypothetical protein
MGWNDSHQYKFEIAERRFGDPSNTDDVADDTRLTVGGIMTTGVRRFTYRNDFGDEWERDIVIERQGSAVGGRRYLACIAGKRNCPPEDCVGVWGYGDFLVASADPSSPEAAELSEWIDPDFDPEEFSLETVNARISARQKSRPW